MAHTMSSPALLLAALVFFTATNLPAQGLFGPIFGFPPITIPGLPGTPPFTIPGTPGTPPIIIPIFPPVNTPPPSTIPGTPPTTIPGTPPTTLPPITLPPVNTPPPSNPNIPQVLNVVGQLSCPNGTSSQPANGAVVNLMCTNATGVLNFLGQNITNINGIFNIGVNLPLNSLVLPNCIIRTNLTNVICPLLGTVNSTVLGLVAGVTTAVPGVLGQIFAIVTNLFTVTVT